jgi:hypothetical protein
MGAPLVEGRDLVVHDNMVYMRTTTGLRRIDVIYRRVDDDFIDPLTFRRDSGWARPGLFNAYRAGNVVICNAPGTGVADDKAVYAYVPEIINTTWARTPILPNIETFLCREPAQLTHVLAHLDKFVVKAVGASGGYGMLVGPHSTKAQQAEFADALKADPENYIAQPTIQLSTAPCLIDDAIEPRHVDLRPFILCGEKIVVTPGALTRVAMKKGLAGGQFQPGRRIQGHLGAHRRQGPAAMMLARVADSLYWIGRYVERAEHMCRLSDVMLTATLDRTEAAGQVARMALAAGGRSGRRPEGQEPLRGGAGAGARPRRPRLGGQLAEPRPRERPPGARPDHHRDLGAAQHHPLPDDRPGRRQDLRRRLAGLPARHHRRPTPLQGRGPTPP